MPDIFEIFVQGPRTLARSGRGLGLGLALVRNIARLHGGDVEVSSEGEGQGSEFRIVLPRIQPAVSGAAPSAESGEPERARHRRILIVDDERDAAESLGRLLEQRGHRVRAAGDGMSALEAARTLEPDVALLDLGLPGMDGYDLARRLRERFPKILLVAITGYERDPNRFESSGFDHHIIKPIDFERLYELVQVA